MGLQQWMICGYNIECDVVGFLKIKKINWDQIPQGKNKLGH